MVWRPARQWQADGGFGGGSASCWGHSIRRNSVPCWTELAARSVNSLSRKADQGGGGGKKGGEKR